MSNIHVHQMDTQTDMTVMSSLFVFFTQSFIFRVGLWWCSLSLISCSYANTEWRGPAALHSKTSVCVCVRERDGQGFKIVHLSLCNGWRLCVCVNAVLSERFSLKQTESSVCISRAKVSRVKSKLFEHCHFEKCYGWNSQKSQETKQVIFLA